MRPKYMATRPRRWSVPPCPGYPQDYEFQTNIDIIKIRVYIQLIEVRSSGPSF